MGISSSPNCRLRHNSSCDPHQEKADTAYSGINLAIGIRHSEYSSNGAWFMRTRNSILLVAAALAIGVGLPATSGAGRIRGALRHLDGRHPADDRPAGSRRRRLSVHRLYDLRSAGRLGNGRRGPARQAGAGPRHRMEGRRQATRPNGASPCARASNSTTAATSTPTR